ncbi:LutC/YkgG family protein [Undibacterium curvum]|uniref:LutC/YkgG family protein n=1 Tax=Undibacterium curvum TaxID=2762294 RepID=UPI003D14E37C
MSAARELILQRLRSAAEQSAPAAPVAQLDARIQQHFQAKKRPAAAYLLSEMQKQLELLHAEVLCCKEADWPAQLVQKLSATTVRRVLTHTAHPASQALQACLPAQFELLDFDQPIEHWKQALFEQIDAGFTVVRSAIASTGTLIVAAAPDMPRTMSLVPPLHIALLYASQLHADLYTACQAEGWAQGMPSNLVMISGPSKTSDIQQTLAYGAHGPRALWVVLIDDLGDKLA